MQGEPSQSSYTVVWQVDPTASLSNSKSLRYISSGHIIATGVQKREMMIFFVRVQLRGENLCASSSSFSVQSPSRFRAEPFFRSFFWPDPIKMVKLKAKYISPDQVGGYLLRHLTTTDTKTAELYLYGTSERARTQYLLLLKLARRLRNWFREYYFLQPKSSLFPGELGQMKRKLFDESMAIEDGRHLATMHALFIVVRQFGHLVKIISLCVSSIGATKHGVNNSTKCSNILSVN